MMVMEVVIALLLGQMLAVMLVGPVGRIGVIDHVDADARLTSPDLGYATLERLIRRVVLVGLSAVADVRRARHLLLLGIVVQSVLESQVGLVHVGVVESNLRGEIDVGADRRDRSGRVELHQGGLQLESVHVLRPVRDFVPRESGITSLGVFFFFIYLLSTGALELSTTVLKFIIFKARGYGSEPVARAAARG